ncbi:MAG: hypothetical protein EA353_04030 [Puniceicoccaceae bacterium]|nr:MAG: hypothetical protein EA353_04030 [Puniceicoccaceae bacterium]
MSLVSIKGYYDGKQVQLGEKVRLPQNARLIITVLDYEPSSVADHDREAFLQLSAANLARGYDVDEVEYTEADLKK